MENQVAFTFVESVGRRLRAIRRQQGLSLEDVEQRSDGRWSASAIGAYERGYRNLSLGRLRELADFYNVPISVLVGEIDLRPDTSSSGPGRVTLDLVAIGGVPEAAPIHRYAQSIAMERGDFNGRVISLRRDDLHVLASVLQLSDAELFNRLGQWGVLSLPDRDTAIDLTDEAAAKEAAAGDDTTDEPVSPAAPATTAGPVF